MSVHACTIIPKNCLPLARVLADSLRRACPSATFDTLVIDDRHNLLDDREEPFDLLSLSDLALDRQEINRMAAIYNAAELAAAAKPWLLEHLIERWNEPVIYLGPEIVVYDSLDEILDLSFGHDIVLTPHILEPLPRDGLHPDETEILGSGIYNLGFIAVSPSGTSFLNYWKERLARECIDDPVNMRHLDQRWLDLVPSMFKTHILSGPQYNVAYWNLSHRVLRASDAGYTVNDRALVFFQFSGYSPLVPELLSEDQGGKVRILLSKEPVVRQITEEYGRSLLANGYLDSYKIPYEFGHLSSGFGVDAIVRRAYRSSLIAAERRSNSLPPNPFDDEYGFMEWLNTPEEGMRLSRYLTTLYQMRPDLREYLPRAETSDYEAMMAWHRNEVREGRLDSRVIQRTHVPVTPTVGNDPSEVPGPKLPGIRVVAYFRAEMGVGEIGRLSSETVQASEIPSSTLIDTDTIIRQEHPFKSAERGDLNVNLVCVNADALPRFAERAGKEFFNDRYTIGMWAWELEDFPEAYNAAFQFVDEIWAISEFTRKAIAARTDKPVFAFPTVALPPSVNEGKRTDHLGLAGIDQGRYTFLFCCDLYSVFERKNPLGVLEAFCRAFEISEGPQLIIKALNGEQNLAHLERLKIAALSRPDVIILDEYLDWDVNAELFLSCDCYVSLHRSEGLGLTMAEAMMLGKPVIGTGYSGNLDFMTDEVAYLVPYTLGSVPEGCDPYPVGAVWAEPDLDAAAALMRHVYEHPGEAAALGRLARDHMVAQHSVDAAVPFVRARFEAAQATLSRKAASAPMDESSAIETDDAAPEVAEAGEADLPPLIALALAEPSTDERSRHPHLLRIVRRCLRKLLASRDGHQREVNLALARGTEHLARLWSEGQLVEQEREARLLSLQAMLAELVSRIEGLSLIAPELEELQWAMSSIKEAIIAQAGNVERVATRVGALQRELRFTARRVDDGHRSS